MSNTAVQEICVVGSTLSAYLTQYKEKGPHTKFMTYIKSAAQQLRWADIAQMIEKSGSSVGLAKDWSDLACSSLLAYSKCSPTEQDARLVAGCWTETPTKLIQLLSMFLSNKAHLEKYICSGKQTEKRKRKREIEPPVQVKEQKQESTEEQQEKPQPKPTEETARQSSPVKQQEEKTEVFTNVVFTLLQIPEEKKSDGLYIIERIDEYIKRCEEDCSGLYIV